MQFVSEASLFVYVCHDQAYLTVFAIRNNLNPFKLRTLRTDGTVCYLSVTFQGSYFPIMITSDLSGAAVLYQRGTELEYCSMATVYIANTDQNSDAQAYLDPDGGSFGP